MAALDVDGLFRKFTVPEVQDIEKKVKADIERKKEDLRQMVGRRYRDIIEAADSIKEMQVSSEHVLTSIRHIERSVDNLHNIQQQLVVASHRAKLQSNVASPSISLESTAKFIADLLDLIYDCLSDHLPLDAAWCFMIADYLYGVWKFNCAQRKSEHREIETAAAAFLASRFANISSLRNAIIEVSAAVISDCSKPLERILDSICALAFMKRTNLDMVLERFLQCRKESLHALFSNPEHTSREQICACLTILEKTIFQVYQLFAVFGDEISTSRTLNKLRNLVSSRWQPNIIERYAKRQPRLFNMHLSENVDYSKIFPISAIGDVQENRLSDLSKPWMKEVVDYGVGKLSDLILNFDTMEALIVLKENIISALQAESDSLTWSDACQKVLGEDFSLWHRLAANLLEEQTKKLIIRDIGSAFNDLASSNYYKRIEVTETKDAPGRVIVTDQWWHELRTDTVIAGVFTTLQLKARGLTEEIYRPVAELDKKIAQVDTALAKFTSSKNINRPLDHNRFALNDVQLQICLAESCIRAMNRLIEDIQQQALIWKKDGSMKDVPEITLQKVISTAKLMQCLGDSNVSIRQCIVRAFSKEGKSKSPLEIDEWSDVKKSLQDCAMQLYRFWAEYIVDHVTSAFRERLSEATIDISVWFDLAQEWEAIELEEETEEGQKVLSKIFIPAAPSNYVMTLLHGISRCILDIGAHSVPSEILIGISKSLRSLVVQSFQSVFSQGDGSTVGSDVSSSVKLCQKQAVQLLFDFSVLTQLLQQPSSIERDELSQTNERIQFVINKLESIIDPFDLDVLKPRLKRNVIKVLQKSQALYRILYSTEVLRSSSLSSKAPTTTGSGSDTAQLLPLSICQSRFYLLPLVADVEKPAVNVGRPASLRQTGVSSTGDTTKFEISGNRERTTSPYQQSSSRTQVPGASLASTFYDKLSSSWFGSGT